MGAALTQLLEALEAGGDDEVGPLVDLPRVVGVVVQSRLDRLSNDSLSVLHRELGGLVLEDVHLP